MTLTRSDILRWLRETDEVTLTELWSMAEETTLRVKGPYVHLRGLVEISNICRRRCAYCGINAGNISVTRYRMAPDEIVESARTAVRLGYGTVVLQSGEDPGFTGETIGGVIRRIREEADCAITLSLGERSDDDLMLWRDAGADRYLLRFETSDPSLYERIHPGEKNSLEGRLKMLKRLQEMGYEAGSGIMVGIPGQGYETVADDIELFRTMDLDMIGIGPWIPHPGTPLYNFPTPLPADDQVPASEIMANKVLALTRLVRPDANLPGTTALEIMNRETGRAHALRRGANVIMPNVTPEYYRRLYEIYPGKAERLLPPEETDRAIRAMIVSLGRTPGEGRGGRREG